MIDAGTGEEGEKDMKGKIFAMFALVSVTLLVLGTNSVSATTYTLSVWISTDKETYNPTDDVTIRVSTSGMVLIQDLDTPIDELLRTSGVYWISCSVVNEEGNVVFRGAQQVINHDDNLHYAGATFVWENPPAGEYTVYGTITAELVPIDYTGTTNEGLVSTLPADSDDTKTLETASGTASTTFTVVGPPADVPGSDHIPENQGTTNNPNL